MITVRHDDTNPGLLTLVSNIALPSSIAGDVDGQFLSTASGCYVFSDTNISNQRLYVFEPLATEQKYINLKPMVLPGSISAKFTAGPQLDVPSPGDLYNLLVPSFDSFVSNFADINEPSPFLTNSPHIFTPQRSMLVHVDVMLRVVSGEPNSLQNWSLTISAGFPEMLTDQKTFTDVHTFHLHGDLVVNAGTPIQMVIYDPPPRLTAIGLMNFSIHFLRYV